jgi:hypothetical protein
MSIFKHLAKRGFALNSQVNIKALLNNASLYNTLLADNAKTHIVVQIINSDTSPLEISRAQLFSGSTFLTGYAFSSTGSTTVATSETKTAIL